MKLILLFSIGLTLILSACDKQDTVTGPTPDKTNYEMYSQQASVNAVSSHDSLVKATHHKDTVAMHQYDATYHHHDSTFRYYHGMHHHDTTDRKHQHHHVIDSLHKVHSPYHPH